MEIRIDLDGDGQSIVGNCVVDAPRELLFEAWSDPNHLSQWWTPYDVKTTTTSFELRPGGAWRFEMHGPDGRRNQNCLRFGEIARPERIVYRIGDTDPLTVDVTFENSHGSTRLTMRGRFSSAAARTRAIAEFGANKGLAQTLSRLAQYGLMLSGKEPVFSIDRTFAASRDLVWATFTEPRHLAHWWAPKGFAFVMCDMNLFEGGVFHYGLKALDGPIMWGKWTLRKIERPTRLVFIAAYSDEHGNEARHPRSPSWPLRMLTTVALDAPGDGSTKVSICRSPLEPTDIERKTFAAGMETMNRGWDQVLGQLADYLSKAQ